MTESSGAARLLRQLREERGRSLRSAADELGVAPSHLSRWERGEKAPSGELLKRAARYYGVDEELMALDAGRVPDDVLRILQKNPQLLDELRDRHPL